MDAVAFDAIVSGIYRAASGLGDWRVPLEEIAREFGLWAAQIIGVNKQSQTLLFSIEGSLKDRGASPEAALDYLRTYHAVNPRMQPSMQLEKGAWMHCHEHFDEAYVAGSAFYQDFLIPYGGRYLSGTKIIDDDQFLVMFGAMRGMGSQPLNADEVGELSRLCGHMVESMSNYLSLRATYAQAGVGKQLLDEFRHPALLVDPYRAVVYRNGLAADLLARTEALSVKDAQLRCVRNDDDVLLMEALRSLDLHATPSRGADRRNRSFVRLGRAERGGGLALFLTAIRPENVMQVFGQASLALVVLHLPVGERLFDPFIVGEVFGLTPAESKVAVRIGRGQSLEQIARESGVALSTVRSQLKEIFAKTGTGRQGELVSLLATLPDF